MAPELYSNERANKQYFEQVHKNSILCNKYLMMAFKTLVLTSVVINIFLKGSHNNLNIFTLCLIDK